MVHPATVRRRLQKGWSLQDALHKPVQNAATDLTGQRFGRLVVLERAGVRRWTTGRQATQWLCRCDCGNESMGLTQSLRCGDTRSCGCLQRDITRERATHGHAREGQRRPEYRAWRAMKNRCFRENDSGYRDYGGRGITVCRRWLKYENFFADMGPRPFGCSLDRIDNNGHYEPSNCRWATRSEQARNTRTNNLRGLDGARLAWKDAAHILAIPTQMLHRKIRAALSC